MTYTLTPKMVEAITDVEVAFSTTSLLPKWEEIPDRYKKGGTIESKIVESMIYGSEMPEMYVHFKDGFTIKLVQRCVDSHLASFRVKHEHKCAGVAYMISLMCDFGEDN